MTFGPGYFWAEVDVNSGPTGKICSAWHGESDKPMSSDVPFGSWVLMKISLPPTEEYSPHTGYMVTYEWVDPKHKKPIEKQSCICFGGRAKGCKAHD